MADLNTFDKVINDDDFKSLDIESKKRVLDRFYNNVVLPYAQQQNLAEEEINNVRNRYYSRVNQVLSINKEDDKNKFRFIQTPIGEQYIPEDYEAAKQQISPIKDILTTPGVLGTAVGIGLTPVTAGMSIPASLGVMSAGMAGTELARQLIKGEDIEPKEIAKEGLITAGIGGTIGGFSKLIRSIPFKKGMAMALSKIGLGNINENFIKKAIDTNTGEILPKYKEMVENTIKNTGKIAVRETKFVEEDGAKKVMEMGKKLKDFRIMLGKKISDFEEDIVAKNPNISVDITDVKENLKNVAESLKKAGLSEIPEYKSVISFINKQKEIPNSMPLKDAINLERNIRNNLINFSKSSMEVVSETPVEKQLRDFTFGISKKIKETLSTLPNKKDVNVYSDFKDYVNLYDEVSPLFNTKNKLEAIDKFKKVSKIIGESGAKGEVIENLVSKMPQGIGKTYKQSINNTLNDLVKMSATHNIYNQAAYSPSGVVAFVSRSLQSPLMKGYLRAVSKEPSTGKAFPINVSLYEAMRGLEDEISK